MRPNLIFLKQSFFKKLSFLVSFSVFLLFLNACKVKRDFISSSKTINQTSETPKTDLSSIIDHQSQFSTFTTKASTALNLNGKQNDVTLNIRIKKGEKIWISITAIAGIEVARAIFTQDSIKILDRLNEQFINKSFDFIRGFTHEKIDYQTLEALLVGNCPPFSLMDFNKLIVANDSISIIGNQQNLSYNLQFNQQFKTIDFSLSDNFGQNRLLVNTSVFEEISKQLFPANLKIEAFSNNKELKVVMFYHKTEIDIPLEFPFNVPKRFSVID